MKKYTYTGTLTPIERETTLAYNDEERKWIVDTAVPKHYRRFLKQGWTQLSETTTPDGKFVSAEFEACEKAISIGRAERPKRTMTPEHISALQAARQIRTQNN